VKVQDSYLPSFCTWAVFLVPNFGQNIHTFVVIPPAIAEISMVVYLLAIGVKIVPRRTGARRP
jgi:hypothetical protein